jgi:uncharacterized protein (DUF4415 family)
MEKTNKRPGRPRKGKDLRVHISGRVEAGALAKVLRKYKTFQAFLNKAVEDFTKT